jgi:hypothetical protein
LLYQLSYALDDSVLLSGRKTFQYRTFWPLAQQAMANSAVSVRL